MMDDRKKIASSTLQTVRLHNSFSNSRLDTVRTTKIKLCLEILINTTFQTYVDCNATDFLLENKDLLLQVVDDVL